MLPILTNVPFFVLNRLIVIAAQKDRVRDETNETNETNETDETNETNKTNALIIDRHEGSRIS